MKKTIIEYVGKVIRNLYYSRQPRVCYDFAAWASAQSLPMIELYPPVFPEVKPYIGDDEEARKESVFHSDVLLMPQTMAMIEGGVIRDSLGLVELPDKQVCYQGNWYLPYLKSQPAYKRRFTRYRRHLQGDVFSLLCLWGEEYYHWFHDVLPRLEFALPYLPSGTRFLIQEYPKRYQLDSLRAYGIEESRIELQPMIVESKVERLWFATPIGHTSLGSGKAVRKVAERLSAFYGSVSTSKSTRIYISRKKAMRRRVVNEEELEPLLRDYGFCVETCEDMLLADQVALFANANIILGPHGGGLINMIFSKSNSLVAEIVVGSTVPCYWVLAKQLGHTICRLKALPFGGVGGIDMKVEPDVLQNWLSRL